MRPPALITALQEAGVLSEDAVTAPDAVLDLDTAEMIVGDLGHNTRILQGHIRDATVRKAVQHLQSGSTSEYKRPRMPKMRKQL